jgi:hypothetical protein
MKNKLFLALALAGAVACKKDKPAEPSTGNDVNAQVTDFINKLDLTKDLATQVEAFAKTLKNDTEMENLLVGLSREAEPKTWTLVSFDKPVNVSNNETVNFSWVDNNKTITLPTSFSDKAFSYAQYKEKYDETISFKEAKPFKLETQEEPFLTYSDTRIYTKEGVIELRTYRQCEKITGNTWTPEEPWKRNIVETFFYNAYGEISNFDGLDGQDKYFNNITKKAITDNLQKDVCWEYLIVTSMTLEKNPNNAGEIILKKKSYTDKDLLKKGSVIIYNYTSFEQLSTNVSYK